MNFRFRVARGLRVQNKPFNEDEGMELRSEDFDDDEEFCQAIASHVLETLRDYEEGESDETDKFTSLPVGRK